jgi:hypothetical protein
MGWAATRYVLDLPSLSTEVPMDINFHLFENFSILDQRQRFSTLPLQQQPALGALCHFLFQAPSAQAALRARYCTVPALASADRRPLA